MQIVERFYLCIVKFTCLQRIGKLNFVGLSMSLLLAVVCVNGQTAGSGNNVTLVQPGAPGQPTRVLPSDRAASIPKVSRKDVEFMQGMIMHHAQAVEMVSLIGSKTNNKDVALLGARIGQSQADEIEFMERWLTLRMESTEMKMAAGTGSHSHSGHGNSNEMHLMPGMLSQKQMTVLKNADGPDFDKLFLSGMIQHHNGALIMVKDLFDTAGAGQDAELFNFASDVDSGQRAEINSMQKMLEKLS